MSDDISGRMDAEITLSFESERIAGMVKDSLAPEVNTVGERVEEKIETKGNSLIITLKAKDLIALKAAVNSYINWVGLSHKIGGEFNGGNKP